MNSLAQNDPVAPPGGPGRTLVGAFLLALCATLPPLLILGLRVVPDLQRVREDLAEVRTRLERLEGEQLRLYFSRDPAKAGVDEALAHLRFWADEETRCHAHEVASARERQEQAVKALVAAGPALVERLRREALAEGAAPGGKYFRRGVLAALRRLDEPAAAAVAREMLLSNRHPPQSRLFAAGELLELSRDQGVAALREVVQGNTHLSLTGFDTFLGMYLQRTHDGARGRVLREILRRPTIDRATLVAVVQGIAALPAEDSFRPELAEDLRVLYLEPGRASGRFHSAELLRPQTGMLPLVRLEIVRALGEVLPTSQLGPFLDAAERVERDQGTLGAIRQLRTERLR